MHAWPDLLVRLSREPVVSIASIRGRTRGAGSEFVLACDLRFASREHTLLGLLAAGDLDGPRAERDGYITRLIADDRLEDEVEEIASRLARLRSRGARAHEALRRPADAARRPRAAARPVQIAGVQDGTSAAVTG